MSPLLLRWLRVTGGRPWFEKDHSPCILLFCVTGRGRWCGKKGGDDGCFIYCDCSQPLGHPQLKKIFASPSECFPRIWGQRYIKSFLRKIAIPEKKVYNYNIIPLIAKDLDSPKANFFKGFEYSFTQKNNRI